MVGSGNECFEHTTEGIQGMSPVNLREGRESFAGSGKANTKAHLGTCAQSLQGAQCDRVVSEGRAPG